MLRVGKLAVGGILILCWGTAWAQGTIQVRQPETIPAAKSLSLQDCINLALRNQSTIRQAAAQIEVQTGQVMQAESRLYPGTSVSVGTHLAGSSGQGTQINTSADQLLYDFGRTPAQVAQAKRQRAASQDAFFGTNSDVMLSVKTAYYNLLQSIHLVDVFTAQLNAQNGHLAQAQARLDAGVAPKADVLKAQAAVASAKFDLVTARRNAATSQVALNSAMGVNIQDQLAIKEETEPAPSTVDQAQLVTLALSKRPEVLEGMEVVAANQAGVSIARTTNLPSVSTAVSRNQGINQGAFGTANSWQWTLNLSWSPIDFGATRGAVKAAKAQVVNADEALYNTRQTVTQDVVQSRLNLVAAEEQLAASDSEVASATENLGVATGRYEAGVGILLDVLDAQSALLKAEVDQLSARYGLSNARAALEHAIGTTALEGVSK